MTDDQYWDLFECRWARYAAPDAAVAAVADLPRPRTTDADVAQVAAPEIADGAVTG